MKTLILFCQIMWVLENLDMTKYILIIGEEGIKIIKNKDYEIYKARNKKSSI